MADWLRAIKCYREVAAAIAPKLKKYEALLEEIEKAKKDLFNAKSALYEYRGEVYHGIEESKDEIGADFETVRKLHFEHDNHHGKKTKKGKKAKQPMSHDMSALDIDT